MKLVQLSGIGNLNNAILYTPFAMVDYLAPIVSYVPPSNNVQIVNNNVSPVYIPTYVPYDVLPTVVSDNGGYVAVDMVEDDTMTKEDYFKIHLAIYREAALPAFSNKADMDLFNAEISNILATDLSVINYEEIGAINGWFKNTVNKVADKVKDAVTTVVEKAKDVIQTVVGLPSKGAVLLLLETAGGKVAPAFLYIFITDDNAQILKDNPKIAAKRKRQIDTISKICDFTKIGRTTMYTHLRNGIVKKFGKSPEEVINSKLNVNAISGNGIGLDPATTAIIIAGLGTLAAVVPEILKSFSKDDIPKDDDYSQGNNEPIPDPANGGNNPNNGGNGDDEPKGFFRSTAGIITLILVPLAVVGGGFYLNSKQSNKNK